MHINKYNLWILFFTLVVVMFGFGMVIPIMPFYIKQFGASGSTLGALMAVYAVMQFFFAPFWGSLSDRIGRKPVLMLGVLGNAIAQLMFGLSTQLWMLFAARILAGILSSATLPTAMAYVSDSTSERNRGGGMGIIGAAMGLGMVLGPGLGGFLAKQSLAFPFYLASALSMLALLLIYLLLPEPVTTPRLTEKPAPQNRLTALWQAITGANGFLFFLAFLLVFGLTNFEGIFGLYTADRYNYGPENVGQVLTVIGLLSAIVQGILTGPLTRRFGEVSIIRGALIATAIGFVWMTQAYDQPTILLTVCFFVLSNAMLNPAVSSLLSKRATTGQGVALGLNNSFQSLGRMIGPLWAGLVYDLNRDFPYYSGATIMFIGFVLSWFFLSHSHSQPTIPEVVEKKSEGSLTQNL